MRRFGVRWMRRGCFTGVALAWAGAAVAADPAEAPKVAPPAAWVKTTPPVKLMPVLPGSTAAVRVLLMDTQYRLGHAGTSTYFETVTRAQTPQGLGALGTLTFPWNPESDVVTLHKVNILRGDQVIDALAGHPLTVLRRETNLESAMLDGVLTAALQVEGLQVGDALDVAATYDHADPVEGAHAEAHFAWFDGVEADRLRVRAIWTRPQSVRWRAGDGLDKPKITEAQGVTELTLDMSPLAGLHAPAGAPGRFGHARDIDFSDFSSWADVSALFEPLYRKASTLATGSPLSAEADRIRAASPDAVERATAALTLVQDKVRYVFLGMNDGALTPADADITWARRFGDCKGKTALLLALLRQLGIEAQPALVSTTDGDGLDGRPPMDRVFDHVLVRAVIAGRTYWLDGTRTGDASLARIRTPPFHWALPIQAAGARLVALETPPLDEPDGLTTLRLDATAGVTQPAPAHAEALIRGDAATQVRLQLANATPADLDRALREYWAKTYDFITPKTVSAGFDAASGEERWIMDGSAKMAWDQPAGERTSRYEADGARLGGKTEFKREPGLHADAPFAVNFPTYDKMVETILLPRGQGGFVVEGDDIDQTVAGVAYRRTARVRNGVFTLEASSRSLKPEFPAAEAPAAAAALTAMGDKAVYLREPADYAETGVELAADRTLEPKTAPDFNVRGWARLRAGDYAGGITDFDKSIGLDATVAQVYGNRALARFESGDADGARADVDKALALDAHEMRAHHVAGLLAVREGRFADAVTAFSDAIGRSRAAWLFELRARAYLMTAQFDKALADIDTAAGLDPDWRYVHTFRAWAQQLRGHPDEAAAELDAARAAWPYDPNLRFQIAVQLATLGRWPEARREMDVVTAAKPSARTWLTHEEVRDRSDRAGRIADLDRAHRLDPKADEPIVRRASLEADAGDGGRATADLAAAVSARPDDLDLQVLSLGMTARLGRLDLAREGYAALRPKVAHSAALLNALCWSEAAFRPFLADALADCEAALKLAPLSPNIQDSRAFVLLRLGRLDEAVAGYDRALTFDPYLPPSLFGRGMAKLRKGLAKEGAADLAAARSLSPRAGEELATMGEGP